MVEIEQTNCKSHSLNFIQRRMVDTYCGYIKWRHIQESLPQNSEAEEYLTQLVVRIKNGNTKSSDNYSERRRLISGINIIPEGTENLPQAPCIVVANHCNRGPLRGWWQPILIADEVAKIVGNYQIRYRWIIECKKHHLDNLENRFFFPLLTHHSPQFIEDTTANAIIRVRKKYHQLTEGITDNLLPIMDLIPTEKGLLQVVRTLDEGGIVGIFPTAKDEYKLHRIKPKVGEFIIWLNSRREAVPIIPIGAWYDVQKKEYRMKIGKPLSCGFDPSINKVGDQQIADRIGFQIAALLPLNMQGYYASEVLPSPVTQSLERE